MPFNGSGTYALPAGNPVVTGTTISSTSTNNTNSDIATALTNCLTRDGQSPPSANLPMNSHKLTGLIAGTSDGDSVRYEQIKYIDSVASAGTSGQVLTSAGTGAPTWTTPLSPEGTYLALAGGTMTGAITFVSGQAFTGTLPLAGGTMTGAITFASGQVFLNWAIKTTTYTAVSGDAILADTSGGAFTITLPASPATNDYVAIADYKGTFDTNNLTINSNGLNLMGSVQTLVLNVSYRNVTLVYSGAAQGWVIVL